jgi:hypothetical protein
MATLTDDEIYARSHQLGENMCLLAKDEPLMVTANAVLNVTSVVIAEAADHDPVKVSEEVTRWEISLTSRLAQILGEANREPLEYPMPLPPRPRISKGLETLLVGIVAGLCMALLIGIILG